MMKSEADLSRFMEAQGHSYEVALAEIKRGKKQSHWMWYIFPQIQGLGQSEISRFYAIKDKDEAAAYLKHPVLGARLVEICNALLKLPSNSAHEIFGSPDDLKLKSSMTLFSALENTNPVFQAVLNKFFSGEPDFNTLKKLGQQ